MYDVIDGLIDEAQKGSFLKLKRNKLLN